LRPYVDATDVVYEYRGDLWIASIHEEVTDTLEDFLFYIHRKVDVVHGERVPIQI